MSRFARRLWGGLAVGFVLVVVGCGDTDEDIANGDDPMRALTVARRSERYGSTYWTQTGVADSALWAQAVAYCAGKASGDHPNCDAVHQVQAVEQMSRMPEDRPNGFGLTVPQDTGDATPR
jgi:hypothetical protein